MFVIMKRFITFQCLIVFLILFISACGVKPANDSLVKGQDQGQKSTRSEQKKMVVALVMKTLTNPFFVEMEKGARKAETELGIQLQVRTGAKETSIEQQIQIVEELILQKVDAIVIAPGSSTELVKVLKKAQDAGIKIVNIDNRLDKDECLKEGLKDIPFISVKNDEGAYLSVKELCKLQKGEREAIILEGIREAGNAKLRKEGAEKAFIEDPEIRIVASETANWKIDEAYEVSKVLFQKFPRTSLVFCANDMMALGVVQYLKENNRKDVRVAGFDNLEDAQKEINNGWMQATIDQQADAQGYKGVEAAVQLVKGIKVESELYVPMKVINKDTLSK